MTRYDAIVVGVGAMGSAAAYHLARRGKRVLGLERFEVPNEMGSSHGLTRIIRFAYHEDPAYVPLALRSRELWRQLEEQAGEQLFHVTGSVDAGDPDRSVFRGSVAACVAHDLSHDILSAPELRDRFPAYQLPDRMAAVFQPDGGFLLSERCIAAHASAAVDAGAVVRTGERVVGWDVRGDHVVVRTDADGRYTAETLVLAGGAWSAELAPVPVVPERQVLAWIRPRRPELFEPGRFPVFVLQADDGIYYGFPAHGIPGLKIGRLHHLGEKGGADELSRSPRVEDELLLREGAATYFPEAVGPTLALKVCLFENSPDEHFIVGALPDAPQVIVAAGFSGHGFKFAPVIGEIVAELAVDGATRHDIGFLALERFS